MSTFYAFCTLLLMVCVHSWSNPCDKSPLKETISCDTTQSFEKRAHDLIYNQERHLSNYLDVYQGLSGNAAISVPQLNIDSYEWWNGALHGMGAGHGVNYNGVIKNSTMFPQVITTGSTFNSSLFALIGEAISTEARAMFNNKQSGLDFYAPSVDIFVDPRWGRGQETAGSDPMLLSIYAKQFVSSMQGKNDNNKYLKTAVCTKHFADYTLDNAGNGISRHNFNAIPSQYDQNDTYLVSFKSAVINGNTSCIYCSYNAVNSVPSCANKELLTDTLRKEWNFYGFVISDCGAVADIQTTHHYTNTTGQTINAVFTAGMDLNCGSYTQKYIASSVKSDDVQLSVIQNAIYRSTLVQFRLGMFDTANSTSWAKLGVNDVCTDKHLNISLDAARQGTVLLKNDKNTLPLNIKDINSIAVIGPNAANKDVMKGNYAGKPPFIISILDGISEYIDPSNIVYAKGCDISSNNKSGIASAVNASKHADITILAMGLDQSIESEGHDRSNLMLPGQQDSLIEQVSSAAKGAVILVILSGGCVDIEQAVNNIHIDGILWAGYPGMFGGRAIADIIFGAFNPTGLLDQTWYFNNYTVQMKETDLNMRPNLTTKSVGRGYRYFPGAVLFPFGHGLGYTLFTCTHVQIYNEKQFMINITNSGDKIGGAVVLIYFIPHNNGENGVELKRLVGFDRVNMLQPNESKTVIIDMYDEFYYSEYKKRNGTFVSGGFC
eukprot:430214_1